MTDERIYATEAGEAAAAAAVTSFQSCEFECIVLIVIDECGSELPKMRSNNGLHEFSIVRSMLLNDNFDVTVRRRRPEVIIFCCDLLRPYLVFDIISLCDVTIKSFNIDAFYLYVFICIFC